MERTLNESQLRKLLWRRKISGRSSREPNWQPSDDESGALPTEASRPLQYSEGPEEREACFSSDTVILLRNNVLGLGFYAILISCTFDVVVCFFIILRV